MIYAFWDNDWLFKYLYIFQTPHKETEKVDLWNHESRFKYQVEQEIGKTLKNYIIIRPAIVYGPGDRNGISKDEYHIICGIVESIFYILKIHDLS